MMASNTTDAAKQLTYLAGSLKAPRILDVASRLADQARDAGWSFPTLRLERATINTRSAV